MEEGVEHKWCFTPSKLCHILLLIPLRMYTVARHLIRLPFLVISQIKDKVGQPFLKRGIVLELLEQFHVVCHDCENDLLQRTFTFQPGALLIRITHGILIFFILGYHRRNFENLSANIISIIPVDIAKHIIEV